MILHAGLILRALAAQPHGVDNVARLARSLGVEIDPATMTREEIATTVADAIMREREAMRRAAREAYAMRKRSRNTAAGA